MLIGCITGPDFETIQRQIALARRYCEGVELRHDLLRCTFDIPEFPLIIHTDEKGSVLSDGRTMSVYHNFRETPLDLETVLDGLPEADLYKIATLANSTSDSLRLLAFARKHPEVVVVGLGDLGQITRILSPVVGNPFTFAALGPVAAPGQLQAETLVKTYSHSSLSPSTAAYGLIGNPVSNSPSHEKHNAYFRRQNIDAVYVKMPLSKRELPEVFPLFIKAGFRGLSITMPFKESVIPYIETFEKDAKEIGAVNTITFDGGISGKTTDGLGALNAIEKRAAASGKHFAILGAGGSARAIGYEAVKRGATVSFHSRRFDNFREITTYDVLINTTPIECPIFLEQIIPRTIVMDINHDCKESPLMIRAKALGCKCIYGDEMFDAQAAGQFERWKLLLTGAEKG